MRLKVTRMLCTTWLRTMSLSPSGSLRSYSGPSVSFCRHVLDSSGLPIKRISAL